MCDRLLIHERCIAIQFQKTLPQQFTRSFVPLEIDKQSPTSTSSQQSPRKSRFSQLQYRSLPRTKTSTENERRTCETTSAEALNLSADNFPRHGINFPIKTKIVSPNDSTGSSGTPTPTNAIPPTVPLASPRNGSPMSNGFNSYQEGYRLFQAWVETNIACVWDYDLVKAVADAHFVGILVGGFIVIGGSPRVLAAISHAHSRALLNAPPGWIIAVLGELKECEISVVQRGQFTPLCDALCWTVHKLTRAGIMADQENVLKALSIDFPVMAPPEPSLIHVALTDLIHQRKIFHTSRGYGIVTENTYMPAPVPVKPQMTGKNSPPKLLTMSEALTRAHGAAEVDNVGGVSNVAVQTDLADLLSGIFPTSSILTATPEAAINGYLQRTGSFRGITTNGNSILANGNRLTGKEKYQVYAGHDLSDVTIKGGDKASVLSKILRVSQPRRRLASFNAQFPPPEWSSTNRHVKHLHSVATQTRSSNHPGGPETCWFANIQWAPRSSTLPRRPPRTISTSAVANDAHFRPHSTSPSPVKLLHGCNSQHISIYPVKKNHRNIPSSSPSPCVTSSHNSRNPSPSLYSSTTYVDSNPRSISPCNDGALKYKSPPSITNTDRLHSTSPLRLNQAKNSPPRTFKKPPPSASFYSPPKDQRRKALFMMPSESITLDNFNHKLDSSNHQNEDSHHTKESLNSRPENHHHKKDGSPRRYDKRQHIDSNEVGKSISNSPSKSKGKTKIPHCRSNSEESPRYSEGRDMVLVRAKSKESSKEQDSNKIQLDRANLQLELSSDVHMNNYRKVISSPQKPEGLKNNVFSSIAKGSSSDLTSKNMGYRDVNKCDKKLYAEETHYNTVPELKEGEVTALEEDHMKSSLENPSTKQTDEKRRLKLSLPLTESDFLSGENLKKLHRKSLTSLDHKIESTKDLKKNFLSSPDDIHSVKTYPSLSDLNLTFSSLAAQKILQGVSVNSIDTLVEVNMIAEKRQLTTHNGVTNTDFGFV